ncbi:bifunctional enzyme CysN/CysC [Nocardia tenerifensis]|uniref:Adenylyl-sulfate kinase n=1 Tax=Nocardia tenerifensis TaxID=228006 RepID=A0A318JW12_9NOCA|nr:adenylyl-sulfate kinase [Nocardia tenerifensis]PXX58132.1 bifunctional enzyme CysN/CysC [Nocardia tenerifensis]
MPDLLRLATVGSVDDGKSTLIGRLLYDSKAILDDRLAALEQEGIAQGRDVPDLALLTDGLRAEREQGITIDVAYHYFATPRRRFILADTPGHVQYTRNMVTGASTADLALVLVDARNGLTEQSHRHAFIASLLGVPHFVLCVNKMDLVDWSQARFEEIRAEFTQFAAKLDIHDLAFVPVSALHGDNVVQPSIEMPWYEGTSLLHHLEEIHVASDRNLIDARFPVQYVIRARRRSGDFRGYAGTVRGGVFRRGDEVLALPSRKTSRIEAIFGPGGAAQDEAFTQQAVVLQLADEIDLARGDLLCRSGNRPQTAQDLDAMVCWLSDASALSENRSYSLRHTTAATRTWVRRVDYRLDITTLHRDQAATTLALNEIGRVRLHTSTPLLFDAYRRNRDTGGFILVDEQTNNTVAAGMIIGPAPTAGNVVWHAGDVRREERAGAGATIWLTGLSGAGKSSIAVALEQAMVRSGRPAYVLDGDNLRHGLNADLGFSAAARAENVRRTGEVARMFADAGVVAIVALISPYRDDRDRVRARHEAAGLPFVEVFVDTPLNVCEARDPKGMYAKARAGEISGFTGVDDLYEPPLRAEVVLRPESGDPVALAARLLDALNELTA